MSTLPSQSSILIFSHPEIPHGFSNDGIPQVNINQLNPCNLFSGFEIPPLPVARKIGQLGFDGDIFNFILRAMHLTRGKSINTPEWDEWQQSENTMLDQYKDQGLFWGSSRSHFYSRHLQPCVDLRSQGIGQPYEGLLYL
jgi:hypothetical protein